MVPIERSFQGISVAIETVRIDGELMEIWANEVCDTPIASQHNFIVQPLVTKEWNARAF